MVQETKWRKDARELTVYRTVSGRHLMFLDKLRGDVLHEGAQHWIQDTRMDLWMTFRGVLVWERIHMTNGPVPSRSKELGLTVPHYILGTIIQYNYNINLCTYP